MGLELSRKDISFRDFTGIFYMVVLLCLINIAYFGPKYDQILKILKDSH